MTESSATRRRLVVAAVLLIGVAAVALVLVFFSGLGVLPVSCTPQTGFNHTYVAENDTLIIQHQGGDKLSDRITVSVTDSETNVTATVVWLSESTDDYIRYGDSIAITDREGDGSVRAPWVPFDLNPGDHVRIWWETDTPPRGTCSDTTRGIAGGFTIS
jgi:hypothetical protein